MRWLGKGLVKVGLRFQDEEREDTFRRYFVERHLLFMQVFLLVGAIFSTASLVWYEAIDPVHAPEIRKLKLLVLPFLLGVQAVLLLPAARRHAEKLVILPPLAALSTHLFFISPILDDGVLFNANPTMLTMVFFVAFMRVRYAYILIVTLGSVAAFVIAHHLAPGHTPRLLEINIYFVLGCAGALLWAGFWHERVHRRQFETMEAMEAARAAAEQASQAKMRFLASASHDLRQPIHSLGLNVYAMRSWITNPEVARILGAIESAVGAMERMFNSLLDLSSLSSGMVKPEPVVVAVVELQRELDALFGAATRSKGLDLRIHPCRRYIRSDPVLLRKILHNLVANAVRYCERGGVLIGCRQRGSGLRIEIWDTGPGIPQEDLDSIFVEFVRLGRQGTKDDRGLGIGLAIAREAAQVLGHELAAQSRPGRGSCFSVTVPLVKERPFEAARAPLIKDRVAGAFVAVIDDDQEVLDAMRWLLESWGCHAVLALSGAEACALLGHHERIPDLLVCDYELASGETADDAVRRIHDEIWPDIPVLIVTATGLADDLAEATAGGYRVLRKPLAPSILRAAMNEALRPTGTLS